jgi:endonuclease/exonuclease/phosphatase family metal-dependent hydrolase
MSWSRVSSTPSAGRGRSGEDDRLRLLTFNLLTLSSASGRERHAAVRRLLPELRADVVALQEVTRGPALDQAAELLGPDFAIVDLPGWTADHVGECLGTRWPLGEVATLDEQVGDGAARAACVAVEVHAPQPLGPLLVVHHKAAYQLQLEHVRERQALATAQFVEELVSGRPELPVVLMGDLNAGPDAASLRFLTGRQSLAGSSVRYEDAWEAVHGDAPGHTFSPRNPLVRAGQMPLERGRRIDHVMVRSGPHGPLLDVADCRLVFDEPVDGVWVSDHFGVLAELRAPDHAPGTWTARPTGAMTSDRRDGLISP